MQKFLLTLWPVIFILGVWFMFAHPYFLKGLVPYASNYQVNFFPPWSHYEQNWGPVKNNAMPDIHSQIYPWKMFTIETFKQGQVPLWNPYSFSGNPHLANFQSAVLTPFNGLFFLLPFIDTWRIIIILQPLLAGLFMFLLMRSFNATPLSAVIASTVWMFSGFIVVWMAYGTLAFAILYLPLTLYAIEMFFEKNRFWYLFLLSITIALSFFSGHFQTSIYFIFFAALFLIFKTVQDLKKGFIASIFFLLGIVLSLPQITPSIQLYLHSVRSELFIQGGGIPFYYLVTSFAPDFFGNPVTRNDWFGFYAEWASFVGIIPLLLVFFALVKKKPVALFFIIAAAAALLLAIDSPIQEVIGSLRIPVLSTSNPSRIIVLFSFAISVLAGFGLDNLVKILKEERVRYVLVPFVLWGLLIGLVISLGLFHTPPDKILIALKSLRIPAVLLVFAAIGVARPSYMLLFIMLGISIQSSYFAIKWMPFDPRNNVYPDVPIVGAIRENIGTGRIFGNLGGEFTTYYGFPSIEGYDPLYIARYAEFVRSSFEGQYLKAERSVVRIDRQGKYVGRVLDLLGVNLVFHPVGDTNQGWAYPVWGDENRYTRIYKDAKHELYKNNMVLPRAALFYDYEVIKSDPEIIRQFYADNFDFRKKLILEEDPKVEKKKDATGSAHIAIYRPNNLLISVESKSDGLLFLADNFYQGWKVKVNGKEEKIYRADYTFRAVPVPQGKSEVEFTYNFTF